MQLFNGFYKYRKDKVIVFLYSKANPNDHYDTPIELDDEEYIFVQIASYNEIEEMENNFTS